jgi:4-hydroxybenzoate polyprenyltransferase
LIGCSLVSLAILVSLNLTAVLWGVGSLALVAAYPFMKRITWWPQAWLGIVFSWAALVGWVEVTGALSLAGALLYAGSIAWVVGYDTIYALQDIEDDALVGVKSTARLFGSFVRPAVGLCYAGAYMLWCGAVVVAGGGGLVFSALALVAAGLLAWQLWTLDPDEEGNALLRFKSNHYVGVVLTLALLAEWVW